VTNNDVLRRIRYAFDFDDSKMISIFGQADHVMTREQISNWLKKDEDPDFEVLSDLNLAIYLNGLINDRRGRKEGAQVQPEKRINNNIILRKLKIALDLQADDILRILAISGLEISSHELSAFFRKPDHKHFRKCKDQILRNFVDGIQQEYRKD
jgi:uncharacterized protein YehS (DUF1456 family)